MAALASQGRTRPPVLRALAGGIAAAVSLTSGAAWSQESIGLTIQSDDLFRGVSLSDGRPTLSVDLSADEPEGLYGAVSVIGVGTRHSGLEFLGFIANVGLAERLANGATWEIGVSDSQISTFVERRYVANYAELYAGVARQGLAARLFYSSDYLGEGARALYLDLNETARPGDHWRVFAHQGLLTVVGGDYRTLGGRSHVDFKAGVARELGRVEVRLTASWAAPQTIYPEGHRHRRAALAAGASVYF